MDVNNSSKVTLQLKDSGQKSYSHSRPRNVKRVKQVFISKKGACCKALCTQTQSKFKTCRELLNKDLI